MIFSFYEKPPIIFSKSQHVFLALTSLKNNQGKKRRKEKKKRKEEKKKTRKEKKRYD